MSISPKDLFLSPDLTEEEARQYLSAFGFQDPAAADEHLQALADEPPVREALGDLAELLLDALKRAPDPDAALVAFVRYTATRSSRTMFLRYLADDPQALGVLVEVIGSSPFLAEILIRNAEYLHWLVSQIGREPPDAADLAEELDAVIERTDAGAAQLDALKRVKRREILRIASRDILGFEPLQSTTGQLSMVADLVTDRAVRIAELRIASSIGRPRLPGRFAVIGMGKLGGRELNYSSDIDLLYIYEPDDDGDDAAHGIFQKLGRALTTLLTDYTDESYLYRVDLRLRPMGRRGNIAYSLQQCRQYYEGWGETFERFALIKARPVAGDLELGARFVELVQPFVYRKYLDHTAIEEMFRYKARGDRTHTDLDRDVKEGRGGIREIELFTQVLQLTYGAHEPELRQGSTLAALSALQAAGHITAEVHAVLAQAYEFLRTVEHRLQIVHDRQTHALSRTERELEICARRLAFRDAKVLDAALDAARRRVHEIYQTVFERRPGSSDFKSRQFFRLLVGEASDEEALALLADCGMTDARRALDLIRALDQAADLAPSRAMARNVLANLMAALCRRLPLCAKPEQVLLRLEQVTERAGAAVSFYRTLLENDTLRDLLISILDLGDLPANRLIRYPELLDSLLFAIPPVDELRKQYAQRLSRLDSANRRDGIRRFKTIKEFKIITEWVSDESLELLQVRLSALADACVAQVAAWHAPADSDWAIVALGKLGGQELTVHSDLDLVVLYPGDPDDSETFFARQSFVEAIERDLEEPTAEGVAYHIDTRLRPEGKKGALAIPVEQFHHYLRTRAEIWERLAWTRYRFVAGAGDVAADINAAVEAFVYGPWNPQIPAYVKDLRARMERELIDPAANSLDLKVGRGGLTDIDFVLQMIQIREGHTRPEFRVAGTRQLLDAWPSTPLLPDAELDTLREAYLFLRELETLTRMDADTQVSAIPAVPGRLEAIGRRMKMAEPAGDTLLTTYREITSRVRSIFENVLERL